MPTPPLSLAQIISFARIAAEMDIPLVWYTETQLVAIFIDIQEDDTLHEVQHSYRHVADLMATRTAEDALVLICEEVEEQHCIECKELCDDTYERHDENAPWEGDRLCDECHREVRSDYVDYSYSQRFPYTYRGLKKSDFIL
jgi:hypothetical protein